MKLEGNTVVVTGAGRNVGEAVAAVAAREGAKVAVVDLDEARGRRTVERIEKDHPGAAEYFQADVADQRSVRAMVDSVVDWTGGVDALVNSVAIADRGSTILDLDLERWHQVVDVSLTSAFLCSQAVARHLVDRAAPGNIVNIGSTSAHAGRRNVVAYSVAKAGLVNLTKACAAQLGPHGIRVNMVTPNKVGSPVGEDVEPPDRQRLNMLGTGAEPIDIAEAVLFLASPEAKFITSAELLVDGGALYGGSVG